MKIKKQKSILLTQLIILLALTGYIFTINGLHVKSYIFISKVVNDFDMEEYKGILDESLSTIRMTYDSGLRGAGIKDGWEMFVADVVGFDSKEPETVIKAYLPYMDKYNEEIKALIQPEKNEEPPLEADEEPPPLEDEQEPKIWEVPPGDNLRQTPRPEKKPNEKVYEPEDNYDGKKVSFINTANVSFQADALFKEPLGFQFDNNGAQAIIYHTHTNEGYLDSGAKGVVRVGSALKEILESESNIKTIHNGTVNDKDFNAAYNKSYNTLTNVVRGNKNAKVAFDIHRDSIGGKKGPLKVTVTHKGKKYAKLMFVVGTNKRLYHPNWKKNLGFAIKLQKELNTLCPGIARPIYLSPNRYNQHVSPGVLLLEAGGDGNTLEECKRSMKYFAEALKNVVG